MSLPLTREILDATEHLPIGATLVVPQVSWDDYEYLLGELAGRRYLCLNYDAGTLEIVSPLGDHEAYARFLDDLVRAYADAIDVELEKFGQTTWRRKALNKGAEADASYYVRNAKPVFGKHRIDLNLDPPPDIVVEIDTTRTSLRKFAIYAALSVPELWTYDGETVVFYQLVDAKYATIPESQFLPGLSGQMLAESIQASKAVGQRTALNAFRQLIHSRKT